MSQRQKHCQPRYLFAWWYLEQKKQRRKKRYFFLSPVRLSTGKTMINHYQTASVMFSFMIVWLIVASRTNECRSYVIVLFNDSIDLKPDFIYNQGLLLDTSHYIKWIELINSEFWYFCPIIHLVEIQLDFINSHWLHVCCTQ